MIIDRLMIFAALMASISAFFYVAGACLYDVKQTWRLQRQAAHPYRRRYRRRPLVSVVVISAHEDASPVGDCLLSLLRSRYRKLEIIVANSSSTGGTAETVRRFISNHPKRRIKMYVPREKAKQKDAAIEAYQRYATGELIFFISGNALVDKDTIAKAVDHFNRIPDLSVLSLATKAGESYRVAGLLHEFTLLLRNCSKKASNGLNMDYGAQPLQDATIIADHFMKQWLAFKTEPALQFGNKAVHISYASDAAVVAQPLSYGGLLRHYCQTQTSSLRLLLKAPRTIIANNRNLQGWALLGLRLPFTALFKLSALLWPVLLAYFIFLAFGLHQPIFLGLTWAVAALILVFSILEEEHLRIRQKSKYFILMPVTYGWFCLLSLVNYIVLMAGLRPRRR